MGSPACPECRARELHIADLQRRNAELEQRIRTLEVRLGINSSNSSVPPSANPLGAPKPVRKRKSKRKPGGQPGHPPRLKQLLPPERVNCFEPAFLPRECEQCRGDLPAEPSPGDPEPTRFQTVELPRVLAFVTEYQGHARTCGQCGHVTRAAIPADIRAHSVGPRLTAALSYLTGNHGMSKRGVEEITANLLDAPLSLGTVANLEQEVSAALAPAHQEALQAVRAEEVKHADETSWKLMGKLRWLWAAASLGMVVFVIHAKRSALGLAALLGEEITGILCSDRWSVYNCVAAARRQICWAHLKRDFQKIIDGKGVSAFVGLRGRRLVKKVFAAWHAFQDGQCTRVQLQETLAPVMRSMNKVLVEGWFGNDPKVAKFCKNLLELEPALWTFVTTEGVEPTNNFMERLLRRAVLWRKRSFGCWSEAGCRFVERILTVVQTRRLQGQNVLDYLHDALLAHRAGKPCPKLLAER
jgi:transposase